MTAMTFMFALVSCERPQGTASVDMHVNVTVPSGSGSEMMRMFLFNAESGSLSGELFLSGRNGDTFTRTSTLRCGEYDILAYNFDIPDTFFRGERERNTLEIYTNPVGSNVRKSFLLEDSASVVYAPDFVIAGTSLQTVTGSSSSMTLSAVPVTETWRIVVKADGAQYAAASGCIISGEFTAYRPYAGGCSECGSIYFDLEKGSDRLSADFNTFGHDTERGISITVFVNNGEDVFNYTKTITDLVEQALADGSNTLELSVPIVIPSPKGQQTSGGGFTPVVGDWGKENSEILI